MNKILAAKISNIAIVDDNPENRKAAALAATKVLQEAKVWTFFSAEEAIKALSGDTVPIFDLVITDLKMEDERAGWRVAHAAWTWNIPATIVSGGYKSHGDTYVRIGLPMQRIIGEKDNSEVWEKIFEIVLGGAQNSNGILTALFLGKRADPDPEFAETCANIAMCGIF